MISFLHKESSLDKVDGRLDLPNDESVESGGRSEFGSRRGNQVLLLNFSSDGVGMTEDEVNFGSRSTSIRSEPGYKGMN